VNRLLDIIIYFDSSVIIIAFSNCVLHYDSQSTRLTQDLASIFLRQQIGDSHMVSASSTKVQKTNEMIKEDKLSQIIIISANSSAFYKTCLYTNKRPQGRGRRKHIIFVNDSQN
jgi:hypothetical protein